MSKRCKLRSYYFKNIGSYKVNGNFTEEYVKWLEDKVNGQCKNCNNVLADGFICQGCKHELPMDFNLRTECFCYLCDPNITLAECLSDEPI